MIKDDYIEEFVNNLNRDKVTIVEEDFQKNKLLLQESLEQYHKDNNSFTSYSKTMKDLSFYLQEREK
jgi:hypothetical protein